MIDYFEKLYERSTCKWGHKPDFMLVHFLDLSPKGLALDLGRVKVGTLYSLLRRDLTWSESIYLGQLLTDAFNWLKKGT